MSLQDVRLCVDPEKPEIASRSHSLRTCEEQRVPGLGLMGEPGHPWISSDRTAKKLA